MTSIYSYSLEDLTKIMQAMGQSSYRSKQIFSWLYQKRVNSFDEMSDIAKAFREKLKENFNFSRPSMRIKQESADGTIKCLFRLEDGEEVEVNRGKSYICLVRSSNADKTEINP